MVIRILLVAAILTAVSFADVANSVNLRRTVTVEVAEKSKDAVVNISATKIVRQRIGLFGNDPFFDQFGPTVQRETGSLGSGFIVHPDGYVITNHHVIDRARTVTVELADGRKLSADVISSDPDSDLAVLKIAEAGPFPTLPLGDSSDLMIGEPVIAVGNPLGYAHSVSSGIVSALHRDLQAGPVKLLTDVIQTDAAINPGNSGGPLLNAYGQVIGINTAIRGDAQNIGFAIQVNTLRDIIPELLAPQQTAKVMLPFQLRERRTLTPPCHVKSEVTLEGRVVSKINGRPVRDIIDASVQLLRVRAGDQVLVELADGRTERFTAAPVPLSEGMAIARDRLGLRLETVTPALAQRYGLAVDYGMHIVEVAANSPAARAGLQPGDVIVQIGRYIVKNENDFSQLMTALPEAGRVRFAAFRGNRLGATFIEL
ncbi:MAG: trypsin-like peptidase domain-containing protein [Phycisphaerae bacterium]|nr:trypsin-like peptidase domain-containing protein [Phycisphaerae bacterium]MDW8261878.1 trypsin-like peptidase domain-containing protein [Phycisphaerales bacterium]